MKKVIVSTNYDNMTGLKQNLAETEGFSLFNAGMKETDNGYVEVKPVVCWCCEKNCFEEYHDQNTDLLFIQDNSVELPNGFVVNPITDYWLAHISTFENQSRIARQFDPDHIAKGHHAEEGSGEWSYHRIVAQIMVDDAIPADKKAEKIIEEIWPSEKAQRKVDRSEGLRLLKQYQKQAPSGDCPPVFNKGKEMKEAYDDLTTKTLDAKNLKDYTEVLNKLRDAFFAYYY